MSTLVSASFRTELDFASDVRAGLTQAGQKELPSSYFYDDLGSALFEAITLLPEYGLTRADNRILREHSSDIADRSPGFLLVAELGSGTGVKTRHLLQALQLRQPLIRYCPIDVSRSALAQCGRDLSAVAHVDPILDSYIPGIRRVAASRQPFESMLVLFLGSTIGNFSRAAAIDFLRALRGELKPGDYLLLGADLVKPRERLLQAYDDPTGVTAAFNLNLLGRVNRELGGDFDPRRFRHEARYGEQCIEMHLRSLSRQAVDIPGAGCRIHFAPGETIRTESCHKYEPRQLEDMAGASGFRIEANWTDREWPFVETLWTVK